MVRYLVVSSVQNVLANANKPKSNGIWLIGLGVFYLVLFVALYPRVRQRAGRGGSGRARLITGAVVAPVLIILGFVQIIQGR